MSKLRLSLLLPLLLQPLFADTATIRGSVGSAVANGTVTVIRDADRDGLTDAQEATANTDPYKADSDGDGLLDGVDTLPLLNEFSDNPDKIGLRNSGGVNLANNLRAAWGFEKMGTGTFLDSSGNNFTGTITGPVTQGASNSGPISKAGVFPAAGSYLSISSQVFNGLTDKTHLTFSFWYKQDAIAAGDGLYRTIFSHQTNSNPEMSVSIAYGIIGGLPKLSLISDYSNPSNGSLISGVFFIPRVGDDSNASNPAMRLDDGAWHHILLVVNGSSKVIYVDGDFTTPAQTTSVGFTGTGTHTYIGKFSSYAGYNGRGIQGSLDQFLIYNRVLTAAELQALWNYDTDGDGMSDKDEIANGSKRYVYEPDVDYDGLTNAEETAANGQITFNGASKVFGVTDPKKQDTDGDGFGDYWEAKYYYAGRVDPNNAALPTMVDNAATTTFNEADYDNDGLSNYDECIYGTNPNQTDTDGDGKSDKEEADYGSNPNDLNDNPLTPLDFYGEEIPGSYEPVGDVGTILKGEDDESVKVRIGLDTDAAANGGTSTGSMGAYWNTEIWQLKVGAASVRAPSRTAMSPLKKLSLDPTHFYEITVSSLGTVDNSAPNDTLHDYHYRAIVDTGSSPFILCDLQGLLGIKNDPVVKHDGPIDTMFTGSKKAYLVPLDNFSWATSYSGGDAVGPKYRKVALNGRPLADEKPQHEEESDQPEEETYIDAFNLGLHHDTSFVYTPIAASDLALQVNASTAETSFTSRSGLRPAERFDLPFGVGWTSNLCSYVEVVETIGDTDSNDPATVNVVDEAGGSQRFATRNFQSFFPWPSTRSDKKAYLNNLTRNGDNFTLQKKFGNTLTFTKCETWFMYSSDRLNGSTTAKRHTYWRLAEVRDRFGVRLQYDYDTEPGVPNDYALIPRRIFSPDRQGQYIDIVRSSDSRRVESITDSKGRTTTFNVTPTTGEYALPPNGSAAAWKLNDVTFPDGTTTHYTYDSDVEQETDNTDPDNVRITYYYHTNLESVTDKRGNTHTFTYGFDQGKSYWDSSVKGTRCAVPLETLPADVRAEVEKQLSERMDEGHRTEKTMYGQPRRVTLVTLPDDLGQASFVSQGGVRFGDTVEFPAAASTTVTDAENNVTVYEFKDMRAEVVDVDRTEKSVSKEWMLYYLTTKIYRGGAVGSPGYLGTETYEFDAEAGLALRKATDFSGNATTWDFETSYSTLPSGLPQGSTTMTKWADPTWKKDALDRIETYTYDGASRIMNGITDAFNTLTTFDVDALGRRLDKNVLQGGTVPLAQERYDYTNQRFRAFQTGKTTVAFSNISGQTWEKDLQTSYLPDVNGRLWREIVDPAGEKLITESNYDSLNNKLSTVDPRGNRTRFEYDKLNRLTKVTYPSAGTRAGEAVTTKETWYDLNGNKAAEIDEEGHYTLHQYDVLNRRIKTIRDMDGLGLPTRNGEGLVTEATKGSATGNDLVTTFEYNSVGTLIRQTDPRGFVTRTFVDAIQRPLHVFTGLTPAEAAGTLAACTSVANGSTAKTHMEYLYTDTGLVLPEGGTVKGNPGSSAFDTSGFKPTHVIRHGAVLTATGTLDLHTYAQYDALYRPIRTETQYESGAYAVTETGYTFAQDGKEVIQATDDRGKITRTILDGLKRPLSVTDAYGTALAATSSTVYSSTGLVWKKIDPLTRESETEYDAIGRPVKTWQPDPLTGLVNRATPNDPQLGSACTQTAYDKNGNVTVTINPLGFRWENEYDARNRKIVERQPTVTKTEIVNGTPVASAYQNPVVRTAYDGVGTVISSTNARGHISRSFHDRVYRVTDVLTNPVSGTPSTDSANPGTNDILVHTSYDENGNVLEVADGNGNATRNTYDPLNRLTSTATNPVTGQPSANPASPNSADITVVNAYDDAGNLVQVKDGENHLTGFRYDGLGRKTRTFWDEGSTGVEREEQAAFDGVVQLTRRNAKEQFVTFEYDALNRLEDVLYTGSSIDDRHFTYDLVGNLLGVSYPNETSARQTLRGSAQAFDKANRLTEETSTGATHVHTYDKAGNRLTTTYAASGRFLASTYDKLNRLLTCVEKASASSPTGNLTSYAYDLIGNVTRKVMPNGSVINGTFDALNRKLGEDTRNASGGVISSFDYSQSAGGHPTSYDAVGNVLKIVEQYGNANVRNRTVTNSYDRAYRLGTETAVETGGATIVTAYAYDSANNRTQKVVTGGSNPGTWTSAYGTIADGFNSNQLKSITDGGSSAITFLYDADGNRTEKKVGSVTVQTYSYDRDNRLVSLTDSVKGTFAYTYDQRTRRVGRDETNASGTADEISFAGGLSVQEYTTGNGTPEVEYVRGSDYGGGIGGVLYTIRGGSTRSYNAYNSRGDVVSKTDSSGAITWQSTYEAFGTRTQEQGATEDRQKANTKDEDPTGLLNEGLRYRDLESGVFITRDPAGFVDGPNVYTYVRQNPWTYFDPLGLDPAFAPGISMFQSLTAQQHVEAAKTAAPATAVALPLMALSAVEVPVVVGWAMSPAGAYTIAETLSTGAEIASGYDGPPIIPGPGDLVRAEVQEAKAANELFETTTEAAPVLGNSAKTTVATSEVAAAQAAAGAEEATEKATKTYVTYTKEGPNGEVYSGRTSGESSLTPEEIIARRDAGHHMNEQGFGPAVLDKSSTNRAAVRGREQQLIEANGGAQSMGGTSGNKINGVSPKNPKKEFYTDESNKEFSEE